MDDINFLYLESNLYIPTEKRRWKCNQAVEEMNAFTTLWHIFTHTHTFISERKWVNTLNWEQNVPS